MGAREEIIVLEGVGKDYGAGKYVVPALRDVDLTVEQGEYLAIMGPSGSGKSTLMNVIGCLDRPTYGSYRLDGTDVAKATDSELAELRLRALGFVFQNFQLLPRSTALDNVALPLVYAGVKKKERIQRAMDALASVGLSDRAKHLPSQLSGGQKQRVAIARAMVNHPKVLLADEPTGALDSKSSEQIMNAFEELNDAGTTIVMITHDPGVAARAKKRADIFDGRIRKNW